MRLSVHFIAVARTLLMCQELFWVLDALMNEFCISSDSRRAFWRNFLQGDEGVLKLHGFVRIQGVDLNQVCRET